MKRMLTAEMLVALGAVAFGPIWVAAAPVPKEADKPPSPTEKELAASVKNLRAIATVFKAYQETNKHFPNNVYSPKEETAPSVGGCNSFRIRRTAIFTTCSGSMNRGTRITTKSSFSRCPRCSLRFG